MCEKLGELRKAVGAFAASFDPTSIAPVEARIVVAHAAAIEHMAATVKALAAARMAHSTQWRLDGQRSPAHELAQVTGSTLGAARDVLEMGRRLDQQPGVAAAARRGELSTVQALVISDAATADPTAQPRLLQQAASGSFAELRDECARVKAATRADPEQHRQQIHARRRLRSWTDPDGGWHLAACGSIEHGAQITAALAGIREDLFNQARTQGRREPPDAYAFDALVQLACTATSQDAPSSRVGRRRGAPVTLLLRVDYDTWLRGAPIDGETCELAGYGPISMSAVHDLLEMGDPFVAAVLTKGKALVGVAHLGRRPNAHQQTALHWLYPTCAAQGCPAQVRLQVDHRIDWAKTHYTMLDVLDRLCTHHHALKTRHGWQLTHGAGKRPFVPPDDPRHPRHDLAGAHRPNPPP